MHQPAGVHLLLAHGWLSINVPYSCPWHTCLPTCGVNILERKSLFLQVKGLPRNAEFICLLKVRQKLSRAIIFENILKGCVWMEDRYLDKHSRTLNNML